MKQIKWVLSSRSAVRASVLVLAGIVLLVSPAYAQQQWVGGPSGPIYYDLGSVGIGTSSPAYRLDAVGGFSHLGYNSNGAVPPSDDVNGGLIVGWNRSTGGAEVNLYNAFGGWSGTNAKSFVFSQKTGASTYNDLLTIQGNGNVGIATTTPQYTLAVNGTIGTKEVVVTNSGWPDYVFSANYQLRPLTDLAGYIKEHGHLPDIPSAKEVLEKGVGVGDMQGKLLAKIEELTLHMIRAEQENRELKERLARLEARGAF